MLLEHSHTADVISDQYRLDEIDTSEEYLNLIKIYKKRVKPVEVDFRQMVSWLKMGDQLTHHIHPYPAKLLPHIAHFFLRAHTFHKHGSKVLDPFCGSGTVALEASIAGYQPLVADANPLSLAITNVKTTPYDIEQLKIACDSVIARAARYKSGPVIDIVNAHLWYSAEKKKKLEVVLRAIKEEIDSSIKTFLLVCFSACARRLSYADPAVSVPVKLKEKEKLSAAANIKISERLKWLENVSVLTEFKRCVDDNIERIKSANYSYPYRAGARVVGLDARNLAVEGNLLPADSVPLIITSPPYGSAQKYIRSSSLSLNWLGMAGPKDLAVLEGRSIGREHVPLRRESANPVFELPAKYETQLRKIARTNLIRADITRRYLSEMKEAIVEMKRVLSPGGRVVIVIGNNQVSGHTLRNDEFIRGVFEDLGVNLELSLIDHIKSRGLMTKRNRTASLISRESVLVFKKD